jgi:hypothetical protein
MKKITKQCMAMVAKTGLRKAIIESILGTLLSLYVSCGQGDAGCSL